MNNIKDEMIAVKRLGEMIGYGNMIECAKALWNESLQHKRFDDVMPNYEQCAKELNKHFSLIAERCDNSCL